MIQYEIIYNDKTTEYIEAYGYHRNGKRFVFDIGHGNTYIVSNVKAVRMLSK